MYVCFPTWMLDFLWNNSRYTYIHHIYHTWSIWAIAFGKILIDTNKTHFQTRQTKVFSWFLLNLGPHNICVYSWQGPTDRRYVEFGRCCPVCTLGRAAFRRIYKVTRFPPSFQGSPSSTWRIIPFSKWLITIVSKSPKWGGFPSKWPEWLINGGY